MSSMKSNAQPIDMWNRDYQAERVRFGKKLHEQDKKDTCLNFLFIGIFTHLIHIFVVVIFVSFFAMFIIVARESNGWNQNDLYEEQVMKLADAMKYNATYHMLSQIMEPMGAKFG